MMQKVHFRSTSIAQKRSCSSEATTPCQQRPSFASLTFSENNDRARSARAFFLRWPRSEGFIRFDAPFRCSRTSKSLLWPLEWNGRSLLRNKGLASAVLITAAFPFIETNKCGSKCGGFISLMITFASYS